MPGRVFRILAAIGFVAAFLLLALVAYWLFWPTKGLTLYRPIVESSVRQGGLLHSTITYCVDARTPLPMRIDREVVLQNHATAFTIPEIRYTISQPCETKLRAFAIPEYVPPGTYYLAVTTSLEVNPLRTIQQTWRTATFEVVAK